MTEGNRIKSGVLAVLDIDKSFYDAHPDYTIHDFCTAEPAQPHIANLLLTADEWELSFFMIEYMGADGNEPPRVNIIVGYYPDIDMRDDTDQAELAKLDVALTKEYGVRRWTR